jgi:Protein of unknown function (DUF3455)
MNRNFEQTASTTRVRKFLVTALALLAVFVLVNQAMAQTIPSPVTPTQITPQNGDVAFLVGHAKGTQGYVCLPTKADPNVFSFTVNNARPEATLFTNFFGHDFQIITHFLSPDTHPNENAPSPVAFGNATWQSSFDSSRIWAQTTGTLPAGTDPSCPNANSIACLLLQSIGNDVGPTGGKLLADTTFVQRLNTKGGLAPTTGCATATDVGKQALVPYTADYYFFHAAN